METEKILIIFVTLLTVVDPLGSVPIYMPLANRFPKTLHLRIIIFSCFIALLISSGFLLAGRALFSTLGIEVYSIYAAGGVLLFIMGLDLIYGRPKKAGVESDSDYEVGENYREVCVFPLAIPMLSGAGTIATLVMFASSFSSLCDYVIVFFIMLLVYCICGITMHFSKYLLRLFGNTGINIMERVMGIILCALAVQFIANSVSLFVSSLPK